MQSIIRWTAWFLPLMLLGLATNRALGENLPNLKQKPDLKGAVKNKRGEPVTGASVFIYTAAPKEGVGILCPSCYVDCSKRANTGKSGEFKIESLDPTLLFRVLVVAKGYEPKFIGKVDPAAKELEVTLKPGIEGLTPAQQAKGRVTGLKGKPVSGAVVSIRGVIRGESTRFGGNDDVDQVAVTDEAGLFTINSKTNFDAVGVEVEASGYAKGVFKRVPTGGGVEELKLTEGATIRGRLVKGGQPLANVEMGISGKEREASVYIGNFTVGTDSEGRFAFVNVPPNRAYLLYGKMGSLGDRGSVPAKVIQVREDGSSLDVGNIEVQPGFTVAGRIQLSDGKPVPPNTRVLLSRDEAWDSFQAKVDDNGRFSFEGVPPETISLSTRIKGYRLSARNRSVNPARPFALEGMIRGGKTNLLVEFEPGKDDVNQRGQWLDLRDELLRGAETDTPSRGDIQVSGIVKDAETGELLETFKFTEGRVQAMDRAQWITTRPHQGKDGKFEAYFDKGRSAPAVMVEADGYLPLSSGPINSDKTNITFALKKGSGPNGVVLKPNGQPVEGAVVRLASLQNGVYVQDNTMKVNERLFQETRTTKTDAEGKFSFSAGFDDYAILVLEEDGFAQVMIDALREKPEVKLQPWARLEGELRIGARPGTNETVRLGLAYLPNEYHPRNFAPLQLFLQTETDQDGKFVFEKLPPINLQVYHSPRVKDERMGTIPVSQTTSFSVKPGEVKRLALGGQGRPVTGRVVVNGYEGKIDWRSDVYALELVRPPREDLPDMIAWSREFAGKLQAAESEEEKKRLIQEAEKTREQTAAKAKAFYATDEGREYYFRHTKRYALNFKQDGTFRAEDVPGGKYRLRIDLRQGGGGPMNFSSPQIASMDREVEIPGAEGERSDEPFDLGALEMQTRSTLAVGKPAPDFEFKTTEGKTLKLSHMAGKFVLLDFWAVWCGPCVAETPHLKAVYDAFRSDPRFCMVGLSLDPQIKTPSDYAKKNELGWIMGHLGEWAKTDIPGKYGVEGIPSIFLIGPDGKIVARDLRGASIKSAVESALAKTESARVAR